MKLAIISRRLADFGYGVEGKSLFIHHMPAVTGEGILIKTPLTGIDVNHYLPNFYRGPLQVIVRSQTQAHGEKLADDVVRCLSMEQEQIWSDGESSMLMRQVLLVQLPIRYPRSDGNGIEWSLNFEVTYNQL
jgi:hypothetical protein